MAIKVSKEIADKVLREQIKFDHEHHNPMTDYLCFNRWDIFEEVGLVTFGCGTGKTATSLSLEPKGLLDCVNKRLEQQCSPLIPYEKIEPHNVIFAVPRSVIKQQSAGDYPHTYIIDTYADFIQEEHKGQIGIICTQTLGEWLKDKTVRDELTRVCKLLILDEFHLLDKDYFAGSMRYVKKWVCELCEEGAWRQNAVIALTATPLPYYVPHYEARNNGEKKYFEQFPVRIYNITRYIPNLYQVDSVEVITGAYRDTINKAFPASDNCKELQYINNAGHCLKYVREHDDAIGYWSENNVKVDKQTGQMIGELLDQETINEILDTKVMPAGKNTLIITSKGEVGMNLKDDTVKQVKMESFTPEEVQQVLGRFRNDLDRVIIRMPVGWLDQHRKTVREVAEFIYIVDHSDHNIAQNIMRERYKIQCEEELDADLVDRHIPIVFKWDDEYEIDYSIPMYLDYLETCYHSATNYIDCSYMDGVEVAGRMDYYNNILSKFARHVNFTKWDKENTCEANNRAKASSFDMSEYLNRWLTPRDKEELSAGIGLTDAQGHVRKWTTVKKELIKQGYQIEDKQKKIDGVRVMCSFITQ